MPYSPAYWRSVEDSLQIFYKPESQSYCKKTHKASKGYPKRPKTLGEKIRKHRMDSGLYQKDVARFVGVATDTVTLWEKERTKPNEIHLRRIRKFLKTKKFR